jgi:aryl-alcohol dehydrogenase-like predicted oxidoreductase
MKHRQLGTTGILVSEIGFGAAEIGYENASQAAVDRILGAALETGINVIDTAECYSDSEEKIGASVGHRRSEYLLFTKCGHASGLEYPDWSPELLSRSIDRSLTRLRTDYVDALHLHSCSEEVLRRGDAVRVLEDARAAGKTRFIGYSGDSKDALTAIETGVFDTLQTSINIADQEAIDVTLPLAGAHGMGVIAKRPIANAAWKYETKPPNPYHHEYWERLRVLDYGFLTEPLTKSLGAALRFTLAVPQVSVAILGTKSEERWRDNLDIYRSSALSPEEYAEIRRIWRERSMREWVGQV